MERVPIRLGKLRTAVTESRAQPAVRVLDARAALFAASTTRVCRICTQHTARYTCPRCNAPYCSVACYKRHGDACTEQFYEAHVRDAIQQSEREGASDMNALLSRVKAFQDDALLAEEDHDDDAHERLERLALMDEDELSLDALTPAQRAQFLAEVADGRLSRFITLWTPWWTLDPHVYERETSARRRGLVIQELSSAQSERDDGIEGEDDAPAVAAVRIESGAAFPVGMFTSAMASAMAESAVSSASPLLHFHMAELLFSYALVLRTFNGDWQQDVRGAASALLHLCDVLRADAKYESAGLVLHACLRKRVDAADPDGGSVLASDGANGDAQLAVHDAAQLLRAKVFVLDAVSDTSALLAAHRARIRKRAAKHALALVAKKLAFFQAWALRTPEAALQATAAQLARAATEPRQ